MDDSDAEVVGPDDAEEKACSDGATSPPAGSSKASSVRSDPESSSLEASGDPDREVTLIEGVVEFPTDGEGSSNGPCSPKSGLLIGTNGSPRAAGATGSPAWPWRIASN